MVFTIAVVATLRRPAGAGYRQFLSN